MLLAALWSSERGYSSLIGVLALLVGFLGFSVAIVERGYSSLIGVLALLVGFLGFLMFGGRRPTHGEGSAEVSTDSHHLSPSVVDFFGIVKRDPVIVGASL